ncbi:MAG: fibronectin type III domain-containing protein, partial [Acidobacteriota bacterium]
APLLYGPLEAQTGSLTVSWTPSPPGSDVTLYRVHFGTAPGSLTDVVTVPVPASSVQLTGLLESTEYFVEVVAVRADGCASRPSAQASGTSTGGGPVCLTVTSSGTLYQGGPAREIVLQGAGFAPGLEVGFAQGLLEAIPLVVQSMTVVDSTEIRLDLAAPAETPVGLLQVRVTNPDPEQAPAVCQQGLEVAFNPARADVDGSGRVEGYDLSLLAAVFGAFQRVCTMDAPSAGADGARCDDEEDCGGTPGVTGFCTARACVPSSPVAAGVACRQEGDCGGTPGGTTLCLPSPYNAAVDLDSDGLVDGDDLAELTALFGRSAP